MISYATHNAVLDSLGAIWQQWREAMVAATEREAWDTVERLLEARRRLTRIDDAITDAIADGDDDVVQVWLSFLDEWRDAYTSS